MKKTRRGIVLSIELVAVILVIVVILIAIATAAIRLKRLYIVNGVIREVRAISEGLTNFRSTFGYWPGDVILSKITGELNTGQIESNVQNSVGRINGSNSTGVIRSMSTGTSVNQYLSPFVNLGNGIV